MTGAVPDGTHAALHGPDPPKVARTRRNRTVRYDLLSLPLYLVGQARRLIREVAATRH